MMRITRSGGLLVIDASNISSFRNVWRLLRGKTIHWSFAKHYLDQDRALQVAFHTMIDITTSMRGRTLRVGLLDLRYHSSHNIWKRGWVAFVVSKMRDRINPR
jgi:hypothetical protein